jgi:hypothetical protein
MNDLTPSLERETGLVMLEGLPFGAAGEAPLTPVPGLDLAFDRADGRLCRAMVDTTRRGHSTSVSEQVVMMLVRLFGPEAPGVVFRTAAALDEERAGTRALSPEPGLVGTLSNLACGYAVRATSPIPFGSPRWTAELTELAERAGLPALASARARPQPTIPGTAPVLDVAAEVENLARHEATPSSLQWVLDPADVPEGLFRLGLSPYSDLVVGHEGRPGRIVVEALPGRGANCGELGDCRVRLVDPAVRRVLAQASFTAAGSRVRAELEPPFPLDELLESWIEVVPGKLRTVRSAKTYLTRRALRWADAALRGERAPAGLDPDGTREVWSALAAAAWGQCRLDWAAVGDIDRAYLAARRQAALDRRTRVPPAPSETAAEIAGQTPLASPAYLTEAMGC